MNRSVNLPLTGGAANEESPGGPFFRLFTLGALRLEGRDSGELLHGRRKELALLAFLARRAPRAVTREELAALLWGERESAKARQSLRHALLQLRRALGGGIEVTLAEVKIDRTIVELDVVALEADVGAGRLESAVARWHGEFLIGAEDVGGESFRAWVEAEREASRRLLASTLGRLVDAALDRGETAAALRWTEQWSELSPLDERAHRRRIDVLKAANCLDDALACHAGFVARTRRELDQSPSPAFMAISDELTRSARQSERVAPGSAALLTPDMVDRAAVLADLLVAWHEARAGRSACVVVAGDEGMGKTRLCQEFVRWVRADDTESCVLVAHPSEGDAGVAWSATAQLLEGLADAPGLLGASASALRIVEQVAPALRGVVAHEGTDYDESRIGVADRARVVKAAVEVVESVSAEVPVLLVVDELTSTDPETRHLVAALIERSLPAVLVLLTSCPDALGTAPLAGSIRQSRAVRRLQLHPHDLVATEAHIASMVALTPDDRQRLAARLHAESRGNPLHITELVFALADEGTLVLDRDGRWRVKADLGDRMLPLPSGVRDAIRRRVHSLPSDCRRCLEAAAIADRSVDAALLEHTTRLPPGRLTDALNQLLERRMLREIRVGLTQTASYEITHDAIRRVTREVMPPAQRRELRQSSITQTRGAARRTYSGRRAARWAGGLATAAVLGLAVGLNARARGGKSLDRPAIAVVGIDVTGADTTVGWLADGLPQMIAAKLSGSTAVDIIAPAQTRMVRLRAGQRHGDSLSVAQTLEIARHVRATIAVSGRLLQSSDAALVLELSVRDVSNGRLLRSDVLVHPGPLALADEAAARLIDAAAGRGHDERGLRLAELETSSLDAYQHYVRAVHRSLEGYPSEAIRDLDAALGLDSGFIAAVQLRLLAAMSVNDYATIERLTQTLERFDDRGTDFDRLFWAANQAFWRGDRARSETLARELVRRYPRDPRSYTVAANILGNYGRWAAAEIVVRQALALDSLGIEAGRGPCAPCIGYDNLARIRLARGDWEGAERASRRWTSLQPELPQAWLRLATTLAYTGRYDDAVMAHRRGLALSGDDPFMLGQLARFLIMARRFDEAGSLLAAWQGARDPALRRISLDLGVMLARERGMLRLSNQLAERAIAADSLLGYLDLVRFNTLSRLGEYTAAGRLHERRIHGSPPRRVRPWPPSPGSTRAFCWEHALLADAIAPAGDTLRLLAIADTLQIGCSRSYYARDWTLHHHVRGLVHGASGRHEEAAREFERVPHTVAEAWPRPRVELAKAQLALGRPREAIATIRVAYATPVDAMGRYVSRSELDYHMARAFKAAAMLDSAAVYAAYVRRAWARADPEVLQRYPLPAIATVR